MSVLNLNKNVTFEIKPFLRWWARELAFLVPLKIRQFFYAPQAAIIIRSNAEQFELSYEIGGEQKHLANVARDISKAAAVKNLLADERFKNVIFVFRLSKNDALSKTVNLPLAAQTNILQVVSYELDRYSPFTAEKVYFATRIEHIDAETAQIVVKLLITPRKTLEGFYLDCKNLGITPQIVDVEDFPNDLQNLHDSCNLLPLHLQPKTTSTSRWIIGTLLILLGLLSISSLIFPVWLEYQAVEKLQHKISKIDKEVKAIKNLQSEMDLLREETQLLINEKIAAPSIVATLNEISALMQDDSWLSYLQYSDGQIQLQGESKAASNLLADLEASDYFAKVNFASPVTQDKASGLERFQITVDVTKPENTDAMTQTTSESIDESTEESSLDLPIEETTVEDVITEEVVSENGTSKEQPE